MFVSMLEYKANWNDKQIVRINRFFPSSKTCNECGWIKSDLTLNDREWVCESCRCEHDRDINAAKNILTEGEYMYSRTKAMFNGWLLRHKLQNTSSNSDYAPCIMCRGCQRSCTTDGNIAECNDYMPNHGE